MTALDGTLVNLALPTLAADLGANPSSAIWVVNAFQLAVLCVLLPLATLGDRLGYRRVYLGGTALYTVASLGCTLAPSLSWLVAMRFLQGVGAAGLMSVNLALVRSVYPRARLGRGIALNGMVVSTASVMGPSLAALILSVADWPWLFALNVPLGVLLLWLGARALPATAGQTVASLRPFDVLLNVLSFGLLFLGLDALGTSLGLHGAWLRADHAAALLGLGLLVGVAYVRRQLGLAMPLLPLDLLRIRPFALAIGTSVTAFSTQMLAQIALPFLFLEQLGRTHWQAGALLMAWPAAAVATAPFVGRWIGRRPAGLLCAIGLALMAAGLGALALAVQGVSNATIVGLLLVVGVGFTLFQAPNNHAMATTAPMERSGGAGGMQSSARLTGQMLGAILAAVVFSQWPPSEGLGAPLALGLSAVLAVLAGLVSLTRLR